MNDASNARSYRAGAWFGIFGDHATVLLPPTEKSRVGELWGLVDGGADFDEVLDALISRGLRELPGFVLVSELEQDTKVVIRGGSTAHVTTADGEFELTGSRATTWVERSVSDVSAMVIDVDPGGEGADSDAASYTIECGLVRVSRVEDPAPAATVEPTPAPVPEPFPEPTPVPEPEPFPEPEPQPEPHHEPDTAPNPTVEPDSVETPEETGTPIVTAAPPPPPPADIDHDGMTRAGGWSPGPISRPPGIPGQEPAPSVVSRPVARLVFSSGDELDVDRAVLVGRAPEARRFPSSEQPRLITVSSPHQEISSTHLEVRPGSGADHGSAVITDLGSTNGTVLVQPGLAPEDLQPGIAVQLIPGAVVDLGDGVTIQVLNP